MPKKQQRPEGQRGKTGESGVPPSQSAMDKFKSLARDLVLAPYALMAKKLNL
jgi:hypothetical protein